MSLHPFERFLGVPETADPFALLGVSAERADALAIDEALRRRLAEVFRHPDGRSEDAEIVRAALRESADSIKRAMNQQRMAATASAGEQPAWMRQATRSRSRARSGAAPMFKLTAFDRLVLGTLVACGGWNARSRAQLVALSQTYGVAVSGLLRVMKGLSEYARSGGPRIGVTDIAGKGLPPPIAPLTVAAPPAVGPALLDRLAENLGRELKRGGAWPTIKLAIIFGIATLVLGIIALKLTLNRGDVAKIETPAAVTNDASSPANDSSSPKSAAVVQPGVRIARFPKRPTFLGNGLPADAVNAVDRLPGLPAQLDELARKLAVADGDPSEAVQRQWQADIDTLATSWVIGDASTRNTIDKALLEALRIAADTPAVSDRLLKALNPPVSIATPLDVWRGAWKAGSLARISSTSSLPPVVADRARSQLEIALSQNLRGAVSFETAGDLWLAQRVPQLVTMIPFDDAAFDTWELWISAQRALGTGDRHDAAIMSALRSVLHTEYDLSAQGPVVNVAGRLIDLGLSADSAIVRQRFLDMFDDEQVSARDMWVWTSLLSDSSAAPWFADRFVVPEDADMALRWRIRDDLAKVWPMPASSSAQPSEEASRPKVDEAQAGDWAEVAAIELATPAAAEHSAIMQQIVDASRLNEAAAALVAGVPEETRRLVSEVERGWVTGTKPSANQPGAATPRSGQPLGADGMWALQYAELGKNTDARTDSIRQLRSTAGTDMGPVDAALIVKEAYRGSPAEVRDIAQAVIQEQFKSGPNIAMQLLDQFPDAPAVESVSELIQSMTGRLLPGVRSSTWPAEARLALASHALELRDIGGAPVDALIEPLLFSYAGRLALAKNDPTVTTTPSSPQEAAELLLRTLTAQAEFAAPMQPTPGDLPTLQRRHNSRLSLAEGPIQEFVAHQLAILDVTAYLFAAEQPKLRDEVLRVMREHAAERSGLAGVLEQALDIERAILELWLVRLGLNLPPGVSPQAEQEEDDS